MTDTELLNEVDKLGDLGSIVIDPDLVGETKSANWSHFESTGIRDALKILISR